MILLISRKLLTSNHKTNTYHQHTILVIHDEKEQTLSNDIPELNFTFTKGTFLFSHLGTILEFLSRYQDKGIEVNR